MPYDGVGVGGIELIGAEEKDNTILELSSVGTSCRAV